MYHRVRADRANFSLRSRAASSAATQRKDFGCATRLAATGWPAATSAKEQAGSTGCWRSTALVSPGVLARALAVRAELAFEQLDYDGAADYARACLEFSETCKDGNPAGGLRGCSR